MKKYFGKEKKSRKVPRCKECKSDKDVGLSTYGYKKGEQEKYWECYNCNCVIRKARF
jgi:hypothetical protein